MINKSHYTNLLLHLDYEARHHEHSKLGPPRHAFQQKWWFYLFCLVWGVLRALELLILGMFQHNPKTNKIGKKTNLPNNDLNDNDLGLNFSDCLKLISFHFTKVICSFFTPVQSKHKKSACILAGHYLLPMAYAMGQLQKFNSHKMYVNMNQVGVYILIILRLGLNPKLHKIICYGQTTYDHFLQLSALQKTAPNLQIFFHEPLLKKNFQINLDGQNKLNQKGKFPLTDIKKTENRNDLKILVLLHDNWKHDLFVYRHLLTLLAVRHPSAEIRLQLSNKKKGTKVHTKIGSFKINQPASIGNYDVIFYRGFHLFMFQKHAESNLVYFYEEGSLFNNCLSLTRIKHKNFDVNLLKKHLFQFDKLEN
jgi:hypothetical protein